MPLVAKSHQHTAIMRVVHSPIGVIGITYRAHRLQRVEFLGANITALAVPSSCPFVPRVMQAFDAYFNQGIAIDLPVEWGGTPFQKRVWQALLMIPFASTLTYGELAKKLKTSPRAVGQACKVNPLPIVIPCHRVVAKSTLGGYCGTVEGQMLDRKIWLLAHEQYHLNTSGRILHEASEQAEHSS